MLHACLGYLPGLSSESDALLVLAPSETTGRLQQYSDSDSLGRRMCRNTGLWAQDTVQQRMDRVLSSSDRLHRTLPSYKYKSTREVSGSVEAREISEEDGEMGRGTHFEPFGIHQSSPDSEEKITVALQSSCVSKRSETPEGAPLQRTASVARSLFLE